MQKASVSGSRKASLFGGRGDQQLSPFMRDTLQHRREPTEREGLNGYDRRRPNPLKREDLAADTYAGGRFRSQMVGGRLPRQTPPYKKR